MAAFCSVEMLLGFITWLLSPAANGLLAFVRKIEQGLATFESMGKSLRKPSCRIDRGDR